MFEVLRRERSTQAAQWEMTMALIGSFLGVKRETYTPALEAMKSQLEKRLNGQAYSATYVRKALIARKEELDHDRIMLERLKELGEKET